MFDEASLLESKILIVDDSPANLRVLFRTLEQGGFSQIIPAESAESALLRLRHLTPDLIMLDIRMPKVDGFRAVSPVAQPGGDRRDAGDLHQRHYRRRGH
jgi:CheY-like chemotaxis protein